MCEISSHTSIILQRSSTPGRFALLHRLVVESRIFGKTIHDSADPGKPGISHSRVGEICVRAGKFHVSNLLAEGNFFLPPLLSPRKTTAVCNTGVYSIDLIRMLVLWPHCIPRNLTRCDSLPWWKLKREYEHEYRIATFDRIVIKWVISAAYC